MRVSQARLREIARNEGLRSSLFALREAEGDVGVWLQALNIARMDKNIKTVLHRHVLMARHGCKEHYIIEGPVKPPYDRSRRQQAKFKVPAGGVSQLPKAQSRKSKSNNGKRKQVVEEEEPTVYERSETQQVYHFEEPSRPKARRGRPVRSAEDTEMEAVREGKRKRADVEPTVSSSTSTAAARRGPKRQPVAAEEPSELFSEQHELSTVEGEPLAPATVNGPYTRTRSQTRQRQVGRVAPQREETVSRQRGGGRYYEQDETQNGGGRYLKEETENSQHGGSRYWKEDTKQRRGAAKPSKNGNNGKQKPAKSVKSSNSNSSKKKMNGDPDWDESTSENCEPQNGGGWYSRSRTMQSGGGRYATVYRF